MMKYLPYITGYASSFGNCITNNLLEPQFFTVSVLIIVLLFIIWLLWYIIQTLISNKNTSHNFSVDGFNELHRATFENDVIASFRLVQKYREVINQPHPGDGYTPFMRACLNGNTQLVILMLSFGAKISVKSRKGESPFYLATFHHIQNPNVRDASCIRTLYYAGANINATNRSGYTPLHLAAMFGHTQLVIWLLKKGADVNVYPSPYVIARLQGHFDTAETLRQGELLAIEQ